MSDLGNGQSPEKDSFFIETSEEELEAEQSEKDLTTYLQKQEELFEPQPQPQPQVQSAVSEPKPQDPPMAKILTVESRFKTQKKRGGHENLKAWGVIAGLILLAFLLLNSAIFNLKSYEIIGNQRVTDQSILTDLGLKEGTNLFRYALSHMNDAPTVDPRLSTVDVYFEWPSSVRIVVEESSTIGYVYFQGMYLCIDRKGQVANTTSDPDDDLPIIVGLSVGSFNIGECLNTDDVERYDAVVAVGTALRKYELEHDINLVNVRVLEDIILYADEMEIRIGSIKDVERKICVVAEVMDMDGLPEGTMHIENMDSQIYIEPKMVETNEMY